MAISKHQYKLAPILFLFVICNTSIINGQTNSNKSIYDWFDSIVGKGNLDINSGEVLQDYDKIINKVDRFYFKDYARATVLYDNLIYNDVLLNYDIYKDDVIIKPNNVFSNTPLILNKEKLLFFFVNGKNFVNLNSKLPVDYEIENGFYEESLINEKFTLYTKHSKHKKDIIIGNNLYDDFTESSNFILLYQNKLYEINSRKSISVILPEHKKSINKYYANNQKLERSNKAKFLEDLFKNLNNTPTNTL